MPAAIDAGFRIYSQFFEFAPFCAIFSDNLSDSCTIFGHCPRTVTMVRRNSMTSRNLRVRSGSRPSSSFQTPIDRRFQPDVHSDPKRRIMESNAQPTDFRSATRRSMVSTASQSFSWSQIGRFGRRLLPSIDPYPKDAIATAYLTNKGRPY